MISPFFVGANVIRNGTPHLDIGRSHDYNRTLRYRRWV